MFAQLFAALDSTPGNPAGDTALPQVSTAALVVVAFVRVQLCRSLACPPQQASNSWNRIHALLEHHGVVPISTADEEHQRDTSGIYNEVSFGAELASVRGVGARFLAPRGLGTDGPSMLARLQSTWSCSRSRTSIARCNFCQTPLAFQSRKRRQQVIPLRKRLVSGSLKPRSNACSGSITPLHIR
jgi:hypothetical protein